MKRYKRIKDLEESNDQAGQYSCQNCLLMHDVEESSNEDTINYHQIL